MKKLTRFLFACILIMTSHLSMTKQARQRLTSVDVINQSLQAQIEFVHVYFTALSGNFHQVIIPAAQFESALINGLKFDGSSIPGCTNIFDSDMHLSLDFESFFVNPKTKNQPKTARIFAYVYQDEVTPFQADPRYLLQQAISKAAACGYEFYVGPEIEFFLLEKNSNGELIPWDTGYYFGVELQQKHETIKFEMIQALLDHGVEIEKLHHEVAPGQHEFSIRYGNAIDLADQIMIAKHIVKQVAGNYGLVATFMPKPFLGMNGSGMHIHFSITDAATGLNLFFDEQDDAFLSTFAHTFIAGVLNKVGDAAVLLNSTVNSFKRLVPGYEAPVYICWAKKNRSALIRIPLINVNQPYAARAEIRSADALCNPYLAFTFLLVSGLAGVENNESFAPAIEENLFKLSLSEIKTRNITTLPSSLSQAITNFENSLTMPTIFNETFIQEFITLKKSEALQFQKAVTNWELQRYL
ncbi:glutamine synthetase [Candidatus Babeliales bacterium]|nr:glutamine synthetase [Candidatus Babeliales bacterium]MBP9843870.1 glutamine synthetase [Candidatus Babeliales bacterium]